jgi:hypothetical protein
MNYSINNKSFCQKALAHQGSPILSINGILTVAILSGAFDALLIPFHSRLIRCLLLEHQREIALRALEIPV